MGKDESHLYSWLDTHTKLVLVIVRIWIHFSREVILIQSRMWVNCDSLMLISGFVKFDASCPPMAGVSRILSDFPVSHRARDVLPSSHPALVLIYPHLQNGAETRVLTRPKSIGWWLNGFFHHVPYEIWWLLGGFQSNPQGDGSARVGQWTVQ